MFNYEDFPEELWKLIKEGIFEKNFRGCSESEVYSIENLTFAKKCYLKVGQKGSLKREKEILLWLKGKLPVPSVLYYSGGEKEFLLLEGIEGSDLVGAMDYLNSKEVVLLIAEGLKMIHSVDIRSCPFNMRLSKKLAEAKRLVELGFVDKKNFEPENLQRAPEEILSKLILEIPSSEELVFTHGDYCLPNIIVQNNKISGFIDIGRGGVADKYQDIALAVRSIRHNLKTGEFVSLFFEGYGLKDIDFSKIEYYILLDELF